MVVLLDPGGNHGHAVVSLECARDVVQRLQQHGRSAPRGGTPGPCPRLRRRPPARAGPSPHVGWRCPPCTERNSSRTPRRATGPPARRPRRRVRADRDPLGPGTPARPARRARRSRATADRRRRGLGSRGGEPSRSPGRSHWRHLPVPSRRPRACGTGSAGAGNRSCGRRSARPARRQLPRAAVPEPWPAGSGIRTRAPPALDRPRPARLRGPRRTANGRLPHGRSRTTATRPRSTARRPQSAASSRSSCCTCRSAATGRRCAVPVRRPGALSQSHGRGPSRTAWPRPW